MARYGHQGGGCMTDWVSSNMSTRSTKSAKTKPTKFEYNQEHSEFHHPPCQQPRTPKAHVPLRCTTPFPVRRWHDNPRVTRRYVYSCVSSPHLAQSRAACYLSFAHPSDLSTAALRHLISPRTEQAAHPRGFGSYATTPPALEILTYNGTPLHAHPSLCSQLAAPVTSIPSKAVLASLLAFRGFPSE